jgi:N-succinyldiaminopimelate aminotransferase
VSPTTADLTDAVFSALTLKARQHRGPLYRLSVGDTWMEPHPAAQAQSLHTDDWPLLHAYAPPHGEPVLLDALAARLRGRSPFPISRDAIQVVSGATVGLSLSCQTVLDPGDEVVIPAPFWPLIPGIVASRGGVPVQVAWWTRLDESGFDAEAALEAAVTERTAAIYVNAPHNPTGRILRQAEADAIARVATRHDLWVLADEVYEDLWYGAQPPVPIWTREDLRDRTLATHSLSKAYAMAGARVGYTHGPPDAMRALRAVQTHQVYCAPRPMQVAAARALRQANDWLVAARQAHGEAGRKAARELGLPAPEAGTFLFLDAKAWLEGGSLVPFLERCLEAGVLLTPGSACGKDYASWVRLCFTNVAPPALERALERLKFVMDGGEPEHRTESAASEERQREPGEACCE